MSILRPATAEDVARWSARDAAGNEPVSLPITELGWTMGDSPRTPGQPNLRTWTFHRTVDLPGLEGLERPCDRSTTQRCELSRWWDHPLTPGGPMQVVSRRTLTTSAGRSLEIQSATQFNGVPRNLELVFLQGPDWYARIFFEGVWLEGMDDALRLLRVV